MSKNEEKNLEEEIRKIQKELKTNKDRFNLVKNIIAVSLICLLIMGPLYVIGDMVELCIILLVVMIGLLISLFIL